MTKVILCDDHIMFRKGMILYLNRDKDIQVVAEASNGEELLNLLPNVDADIIILDIEMPVKNGMAALRDIKKIKPDIKVLMVTMHPEEVYGLAARKLGADGYITKSTEPRMILKAVRKLMAGHEFFNREILAKARSKPQGKPVVKLSKRESEVLSLLATGKSNKEVADELNISDKTVSTYKLRLLKKLNAKSVIDLVNFAKYYANSNSSTSESGKIMI
ncbi:response regulator transcription factor [Schleiferia thermophila]|uniref:LuxR family two component transcriptional regulator n=1 Tax=Schleiferia thermophila TaxID=884107 RepID=A0A369ABE0_9FLAO|nr:response regulator transcription factor [Schleiferia thermophila]RCX05397.1 LuxR family two component transcriptional regulator [Schleiferia thermophila]GCD79097.1 DNA-binding response regulator [Schleiferia thermophila]